MNNDYWLMLFNDYYITPPEWMHLYLSSPTIYPSTFLSVRPWWTSPTRLVQNSESSPLLAQLQARGYAKPCQNAPWRAWGVTSTKLIINTLQYLWLYVCMWFCMHVIYYMVYTGMCLYFVCCIAVLLCYWCNPNALYHIR